MFRERCWALQHRVTSAVGFPQGKFSSDPFRRKLTRRPTKSHGARSRDSVAGKMVSERGCAGLDYRLLLAGPEPLGWSEILDSLEHCLFASGKAGQCLGDTTCGAWRKSTRAPCVPGTQISQRFVSTVGHSARAELGQVFLSKLRCVGIRLSRLGDRRKLRGLQCSPHQALPAPSAWSR